MKKRNLWVAAGLGAAGLIAAQRCYQNRREVLAWQKTRLPALDVHACPTCKQALAAADLFPQGGYYCSTCHKIYPVEGGIGHFIETETLTGFNKTYSGLYDWFSWVYRAFSFFAFAFIGMQEEQARREVTDRLDPNGEPVLEVSIGPGVNLPYLIGRSDVSQIYGLDISPGQLKRCRQYAAHRGWNIQLDLGNAEQLPYADNSFGGVFHIGGINFFNDKQKAIQEMIRVTKPGRRILIADESEKGAKAFEKILPGFKSSFGDQRELIQPPVDLVPETMLEQRVFDIWKGWLYCIEFRKPAA